MNVATRGVRNAFRNPVRTVSIVIILGLSIGLALAMLIARQAVSDKIESVKASVGNTVSVSPAGIRGFEGGGDPLTAKDISKLTKLDHVKSVDQILNDRLTSENTNLQSAVEPGKLGERFSKNNGTSFGGGPIMIQRDASGVTRTFTPPVTVVGSTDPTNLTNTEGGGTFKLTSGKVFETSSSENVAIVGKQLAAKNNLSVGSTFTAYSKEIKVVGIFDAGNEFSNGQVIMPLKTLQTLSDQKDTITSATINVDSVENVDSVTAATKKALGDRADVTNESERAKETLKPLENIQTLSVYSLIGAVVAGAVIILLTMIMIVRERRREIGVVKAIGASNVKVMAQFTTEAITLTVLGAALGIFVGVFAGSPITKMLVDNSTNGPVTQIGGPGAGPGRVLRGVGDNFSNIQTSVGWDIILYGLGVAILIAIIGSALASFFIAKVRPAEVMRTE